MGDLALLVGETTPPVGRYPCAVVVDVKRCKDKRVHSATVRMSDGRKRERDVRKLMLIVEANDDKSAPSFNQASKNQIILIKINSGTLTIRVQHQMY